MRYKPVLILLLVLVYLALNLPAPALAASTYYVSPAGNDSTGTGAEGNPWLTIGHAISSASAGDTIKVMDDDNGSTDDYTENVVIGISLTIENYDSDGTAPQIKASNPLDYAFMITAGSVTVRGLDIYGSASGGGVFLIGVTGCTIDNNRIGWDGSHNNEHGMLIVNSSNNNLTSNTASYNTVHGIYLSNSSSNTITSNTLNENAGNGVNMESNSSSNILTSNTANGNQYGIFMTECSNNAVTSNTLNENDGRIDGDGIMLTDSAGNSIVNNTMNANPGDGIEFYNASNNNISHNTITGNAWGIRLNETSSTNTVTHNTVTGNNKGIAIQASSNNNVMYLNTLGTNSEDNGLVESSSGNTWNSPTKLLYSSTKGYMGNYYDDHSTTDGNSDGIGDTAYSGTGFTDSYPLYQQHTNYTLFTWYLSNPVMYKNDFDNAGGSYAIAGSSNVVWVANEVAQEGVTFPAGATGDESCWTYQVSFTESIDGSDFTLTMGYADSDGSNFVDVSGDPSITLSGTAQIFNGVISNTQSFTVPVGKYLALRIANGSGTSRSVAIGGSWSYVSASDASPEYPLPEPPAIILIGIALIAIFLYAWYRQRGQKTIVSG